MSDTDFLQWEAADRQLPMLGWSDRRVTVVGCGSLGVQVIRELVRRTRAPLVLIDSKCYAEKHEAAGQCGRGDIGLPKVDVHAAWLQDEGIPCASYVGDIRYVPDGVVGPRGLIIVCADNWRCLALGNRLARRTGANLIRANVQPDENCLTVSAFGDASEQDACAECGFSRGHYDWSEDDLRGGCTESTIALGRGLTTTLAKQTATQVMGMALPIWLSHPLDFGHALDAVINRSVHISLRPYATTNFFLPRNAACPHHASRWHRIMWLKQGPRELTLRDLLTSVGIARHDDAKLCFDGVIAFAAHCTGCEGYVSDIVRWLPGGDSLFGVCSVCQSPLRPDDFKTRRTVRLKEIEPFWHSRLSFWKVPPGSIIQVTYGGQVTSFALGIELIGKRGGRHER